MANELRHKESDRAAATQLTQAENDSITAHVLDSQATGDIIYASSSSQLERLGIGSTNDILTVTGGIPAWTSSPTFDSLDIVSGSLDLNSQGSIFNIGAPNNTFGASQLDLVAGFTILGANGLTVQTTAGALTLAPATTIAASKPLLIATGQYLRMEGTAYLWFDATASEIRAPNSDGATLEFLARDNGVGWTVVAKLVGAEDPYLEASKGLLLVPMGQWGVPVEGALIYNAGTNKLNFWNGATWEVVTSV